MCSSLSSRRLIELAFWVFFIEKNKIGRIDDLDVRITTEHVGNYLGENNPELIQCYSETYSQIDSSYLCALAKQTYRRISNIIHANEVKSIILEENLTSAIEFYFINKTILIPSDLLPAEKRYLYSIKKCLSKKFGITEIFTKEISTFKIQN